jgi:hypothetical protein
MIYGNYMMEYRYIINPFEFRKSTEKFSAKSISNGYNIKCKNVSRGGFGLLIDLH